MLLKNVASLVNTIEDADDAAYEPENSHNFRHAETGLFKGE